MASPVPILSGFSNADERNPVRVKLHKSYRSSPEVLRVVSALAAELGGEELISAEPKRWRGRGRARLVVFKDLADESCWLVEEMRRWLAHGQAEDPPAPVSIAVLTRMNVGGRRDAFLTAAADAGLPLELWDHPLHRPEVVALLRKHVDGVVATVGEVAEQIEELYLRCFGDVTPEDASTLVDLREATDELHASIGDTDLRTLVDRIRIGSEIDMPVGHGVHVLTGHAGKGQGFDKVVVLGFEEGQIPIFHVKNLDDGMPEVREELALLHVMASRAKEELVFTYTKIIGRHQQQLCRWATLIKPHVEIVSCLPD